jgi:hypothetical protein
VTTNAILAYLGVALAIPAAVFLLLGVTRRRRQSIGIIDENGGPPRPALVLVLSTRRADIAAGVLLFAASVAIELIGLIRGGPASGEPSGNTAGGIVAVALLTFFCLIGCLCVRRLILGHYRRVLIAQVSKRFEDPRHANAPVIRLRV